MHLSVALALGTALPETRLGDIEVLDPRGHVWSSESASPDPETHGVELRRLEASSPEAAGARPRIAVFVTLTPNADEAAFRRLVDEAPGGFAGVVRIGLKPSTLIDPGEAARISADVAGRLKRLSAEKDRAEVHLAFHGPYGLAVLVGRLLNTMRLVVYEWEDDPERGPAYRPVLALNSGTVGGPITEVLF